MTDAQVTPRPGGRSARVRRAVLDATLELLAEGGVDAVSVGRVAALAGVHETSIYRRWGTRDDVIIDALLSTSEELLPVPDTGALATDLRAFAGSLAGYLESPLGASLLRALTAGSAGPEARQRFWQTRYDLARPMVERAVARGEVATTADPNLVLEALIAPLHLRTLGTGEPLDAPFLDRLVDLLLQGLYKKP